MEHLTRVTMRLEAGAMHWPWSSRTKPAGGLGMASPDHVPPSEPPPSPQPPRCHSPYTLPHRRNSHPAAERRASGPCLPAARVWIAPWTAAARLSLSAARGPGGGDWVRQQGLASLAYLVLRRRRRGAWAAAHAGGSAEEGRGSWVAAWTTAAASAVQSLGRRHTSRNPLLSRLSLGPAENRLAARPRPTLKQMRALIGVWRRHGAVAGRRSGGAVIGYPPSGWRQQ